jgi:uncharacterized membrane protein YkvA (DUF1232 family)
MNFALQSIYNWYRDLLKHPKYRWWVVLASLVYVVNPFDISPDFLPIVGLIDDTVIISMLVAEVSQIAKAKWKEKNQAATSNSKAENLVDISAVTVE